MILNAVASNPKRERKAPLVLVMVVLDTPPVGMVTPEEELEAVTPAISAAMLVSGVTPKLLPADAEGTKEISGASSVRVLSEPSS